MNSTIIPITDTDPYATTSYDNESINNSVLSYQIIDNNDIIYIKTLIDNYLNNTINDIELLNNFKKSILNAVLLDKQFMDIINNSFAEIFDSDQDGILFNSEPNYFELGFIIIESSDLIHTYYNSKQFPIKFKKGLDVKTHIQKLISFSIIHSLLTNKTLSSDNKILMTRKINSIDKAVKLLTNIVFSQSKLWKSICCGGSDNSHKEDFKQILKYNNKGIM